MNNYLLSTLFFITILNGCSKSEKIHLILECKGKTYSLENSSNWKGPKEESWETTKVFEVINDMYNYQTKENEWRLIDGSVIRTNSVGNDPKQKGHPWWEFRLFVDSKEIHYLGDSGNGFEETVNDEGLNQKHENKSTITINRMTGEWNEDKNYKTFWRDGSWLTTRYLVKGNCVKGSQKF